MTAAQAALIAFVCAGPAAWAQDSQRPDPAPPGPIRVFLDCDGCFEDFLRSQLEFVDFVRDRTEADVHVLVTSTQTGSGGVEFTVAFIGVGAYQGIDHTLKAFTVQSDPEDLTRRQLATTMRVGLLNYVTRGGVPQRLSVDVELGPEPARAAASRDRWNSWVFSVRASASFEGEETSRELQIGGAVSADRITPEWKLTFGAEIDHEQERFDIEEDEPFDVERREREVNWLVVKALGDHWSVGAEGELESSTFQNTALSISAAPAVEYNIFPYSVYTTRQLRVLYSLGPRRLRYYEETLRGRNAETLAQHEVSVTFDQTERWGSLEARAEWSQYLHDRALSRLETDAEVSLRVARGLSVFMDVNASRIRDQISLPRRDATPEEILLRLRQLQSGYEYRLSVGMTYTFGSIFSSIVNPRFGQ